MDNELFTCKLLPNSKRLKQVIAEHGNIWIVPWRLDGPRNLQCFNNCLGFWIESLDRKHGRNIRLEDIEINETGEI